MTDRDPPNLDRLIKLMKLTTSSNDGEALAAIRAANSALAKFGGCWERLLLGKVTIVADPFTSLTEPTTRTSKQWGPPSTPRQTLRNPPPPPPPQQPSSFQGASKPYSYNGPQPKRPTQRKRGSRPIPATADDIFNIFT